MDKALQLHRAIGKRIQELRSGRPGMSQEKLAALAGVHRTYVGKLERGESAATVDGIATLCGAMGVTLAEFFQPFDQTIRLRGPRKRREE